MLIGDWYKSNHSTLKYTLDSGRCLLPDGVLINGRGWNGNTFTVNRGKTYRFRVSNVGLTTSLNIRIQGHRMKLVELEGSHTLQNSYSSFDVHLSQSCSFLVTAESPISLPWTTISPSRLGSLTECLPPLRYDPALQQFLGENRTAGPPPGGPTIQIDSSMNQARSVRYSRFIFLLERCSCP